MSAIRLSVFTVATPDLPPERLAAAAKSAGIEGIEWRFADVPAGQENSPPSFWGNNRCSIPTNAGETELAVFADAARQHGLRSLAVVPYLKCGDLPATEQVLRAARTLGASFIRLGVHFYDRTRPYADLYREQRAYLREAADLCQSYGIKGIIEIHHLTIAPSASAAYRLVEGLNPESVGVLFDPGNMVFEGYENYRMGMELLGPYLAHVHAKNAGWQAAEPAPDGSVAWTAGWVGMTKGVVDWTQVVADLKAVGYEGWIGVEDFSGEFDSESMLRSFAEKMERLLG